jgi:hypothetical protein
MTFDRPRTKALRDLIAKEGPLGTDRITGLSIEPDGVFIYTISSVWCDEAGSGTFRGDTETGAVRRFRERVRPATRPAGCVDPRRPTAKPSGKTAPNAQDRGHHGNHR